MTIQVILFLRRLGALIGWYGLMSGLIALVAFIAGVVMLIQEYQRPRETEREILHKVLANWVLAPDYLGKNLIDYTIAWQAEKAGSESIALERVKTSLYQLGENLEIHDEQFPLISVVGFSLRRSDGSEVTSWSPRHPPGPTANTVTDPIPVKKADTDSPGFDLVAKYQVAAEVDAVVDATERYYDRMIRALIVLSGASLLCFGYTVLHVFGLRERVAREAAQEATLDLADRTCHELGNVAFVVANERRNLASHIELLERFVAQESEARTVAAKRSGLDAAQLSRFEHALKREYADREIDPAFEIRRSAALAKDVCKQIAICSDYITLTVRELDGFLKRSELPVSIAPISEIEVFEEAIALLAPRFEAADARLVRVGFEEAGLAVMGDRRLLMHAIVNLLKNAMEASVGAGREPVITVAVRVSGETGWLDVSDNGPGIVETDRPRIFEAGFSTKGAGRGQGLAIVSESVRLQSGLIEISNAVDKGLRVSIGLPLDPFHESR
jgi:signal transduction histidine kinase